MMRIGAQAVKNHILGVIAIVLALGGSAYAGNRLADHKAARETSATAASAARENVLALASKGRRGRRGPQGPPGAQGIQGRTGATGPAGPTVGLSGGALTPGAADQVVSTLGTLNAPTSGRIFVTADITQLSADCSSPNSNGAWGIYVDGTGVTGTSRGFTRLVAQNYDVSGISGLVAAGPHTITLGFDCTAASTSFGFGIGVPSFDAILLGG